MRHKILDPYSDTGTYNTVRHKYGKRYRLPDATYGVSSPTLGLKTTRNTSGMKLYVEKYQYPLNFIFYRNVQRPLVFLIITAK
jgi:hypothetical protein